MDFYKVPLGFGMALVRNFNAMNIYSAMTQEQKQALLEKAQKAQSETEMHQLVDGLTANRLH